MLPLLRKLILPSLITALGVRTAFAQIAPRNTEIGVATGLSALPDAFGAQCGSNFNGGGGGGAELGLSILRRLGYHLAVQADTRLTGNLGLTGCKLSLPPVDTSYAKSLSRNFFATSTIRIAAETPQSLPLFRLTAGTGLAWASPTLPIGVVSLAWSTRGENTRFFVEFERLQARIHAEEQHHNFGAASPPYSRPIVMYPVEHTLRFGLAWQR